MTVEQILGFNLALIVAVASPGPALLLAIQTTVSDGRRAGFAIGCGLAVMASIWTFMALLGLEAVFSLFPWFYGALKLLGAAYLLFIAWQMWRSAKDVVTTHVEPVRNSFRQGLFVNLLNPKSVLFATAVLVVIFPASMSLLENTFVVLNHLIVEIVFYFLLALGMSTTTVRQSYLKMKLYIDRTASVVLGGLGIRLLIDR